MSKFKSKFSLGDTVRVIVDVPGAVGDKWRIVEVRFNIATIRPAYFLAAFLGHHVIELVCDEGILELVP